MEPCPFCGSYNSVPTTVDDDAESGGYLYAITCIDCGAMGPITHERDGVEDVWNKRAEG